MTNNEKEALLDIVKDMREEAEEYVVSAGTEKTQQAMAQLYLAKTLRGYAKRLEGVCKASVDSTQQMSFGNPTNQGMFLSPETQHVMEIEKFKEEFRKKKKTSNIEEQHEGEMALVEGGPAAPSGEESYHSVDPDMPEGAYTILAGAVYKLQITNGQKKLVYDEKKTKKDHKESEKKILLG